MSLRKSFSYCPQMRAPGKGSGCEGAWACFCGALRKENLNHGGNLGAVALVGV
jgi:hypothetical protein